MYSNKEGSKKLNGLLSLDPNVERSSCSYRLSLTVLVRTLWASSSSRLEDISRIYTCEKGVVVASLVVITLVTILPEYKPSSRVCRACINNIAHPFVWNCLCHQTSVVCRRTTYSLDRFNLSVERLIWRKVLCNTTSIFYRSVQV